ncbi:hypothetical protein DM01DRAFT_1334923 [Hesseltinella vesiculosa]|uniref:Uncharacterized protein n=1 Tax=Hesseltinella vesiculosa TaxID=101127 RepID=A0A1X2GLM9_9FUNG|nr:hypothetical protein DM01DRAFT_1334923 [Hesseltinella vesiculosa]
MSQDVEDSDESSETCDALDISATSASAPIQAPTPTPTRLSLCLRPLGEHRFVVGQVDVSDKFYQLQKNVFELAEDGSNSLTPESDVHLLLSLSSILLLQNNNRMHKAMIPFFWPTSLLQNSQAFPRYLAHKLKIPCSVGSQFDPYYPRLPRQSN